MRIVLPPPSQLTPLQLPETRQAPCTAGRFLVAVVPTHNRLAQLRQTLARLLDVPPQTLAAIVVVDNASDDGTMAWLAGLNDSRLHVLRLSANLGGAGGFAAGLKYALRRLDPDWFLLIDDDARPMPGALEAFQAGDVTSWDAIAGAAYRPGGEICEANYPMRDPFASLRTFLRTALLGRKGFHLDAQDYAGDTVLPVDAATFVGLFLSRRAIDLGGLPDRRLFLYGDDVQQTLRLSRAGGRIGFDPALRFEHDTNAPGAGTRGMPLWKLYYRCRNSLIIYREAAGWFFPVVCLVVLLRWVLGASAYKGRRRDYLSVLARAVWHGLCGRTTVAHESILHWTTPPPPRLSAPVPASPRSIVAETLAERSERLALGGACAKPDG